MEKTMKMRNIVEEMMSRKRPVLLDGGLGTLLISMGLPPGMAPERWVIERPEIVRNAHIRYVQAGSEIIQTCTFGANPIRLAKVGMEGLCKDIVSKACLLAKDACRGTKTYIAGDIGPTGEFLHPVGKCTIDEMKEAYREQVYALAEASVDLLLIETMYDIREAMIALEIAMGTGLPVFISMTFEKKKKGFFTIMGDPLRASIERLWDLRPHAVGFNCSVTSETMLDMVKEVADVGANLVCQPNAGKPKVSINGIHYEEDPQVFANNIIRMVNIGVKVIGGCCGTDDRFIRAVKERIEEQWQ